MEFEEEKKQEDHAADPNDGDASQKSIEKSPIKVTVSFLISVVCVVIAATVLITYLVTNNANRFYYSNQLAQQQSVIDRLRDGATSKDGLYFSDLELIAQIFDHYSYYSNNLDKEKLLEAVIDAYVSATGDDYAAYYTEEEYEAIDADFQGDRVGIGVGVVSNSVTVDGVAHEILQITAVYQNSPALQAGVLVGDCIHSVKVGDRYQSVAELGYTNAVSQFSGAVGSTVEFRLFRPADGGYTNLAFSIVRNQYETVSVSYKWAENNEKIGIVHISKFDMTTPHQLRDAVIELQNGGAKHFIFDLRNNPGGEMQSIKSSLSYFLQKGDLILHSINRDGKVAASHYVEVVDGKGDAAAFNVSENEIGMFAGLDIVVLCNENTASAAEVFTATLRDYELATLVGSKTFGKGLIQSTIPLSMFGEYTGYIKLTTYAYVTKCGVTYQDVGIEPHVSVPLSEEAKQYHFYLLPQSIDNQLQAAIAQFE